MHTCKWIFMADETTGTYGAYCGDCQRTLTSQEVEDRLATNADLLEALETARRKIGAVWVVCDTGSAKEKVLDEALTVINEAIRKGETK